MGRLKELKYFTLVMLLFSFVAAGTISSCRDQKKEENTEQSGSEEHPTEEAAAEEEHPTEEGATDEEHPADDGAAAEEHPEN